VAENKELIKSRADSSRKWLIKNKDAYADKMQKGTLTIQEALDLDFHNRSVTIPKGLKELPETKSLKTTAIKTTLKRLNIPLSSPFKTLIDPETFSAEGIKTPFFTQLGNVETQLNRIATEKGFSLDNLYGGQFIRVTGAEGRAVSLGIEAATQSRASAVFGGLPDAKIVANALLANIENPEIDGVDPETKKRYFSKADAIRVRAGLAMMSLAPFRPGEVANITIDQLEFDENNNPIRIKESRRGRKYLPNVDVPEVMQAILKDAVELAKDNPNAPLFASVNQMSKASTLDKGSLKAILAPYANQMKSDTRTGVIAGSKDIRKLTGSLIAYAVGGQDNPEEYKRVVSEILGHGDPDFNTVMDTSKKYYLTQFSQEGVKSPTYNALDALQHYYARVAEAPSLNFLPKIMNVSAKSLTTVDEAKVTPVISNVSETPQAESAKKTLTDVDAEAFDELVSNRRAKLKLSTAKFNATTIGLNVKNLKEELEYLAYLEANEETLFEGRKKDVDLQLKTEEYEAEQRGLKKAAIEQKNQGDADSIIDKFREMFGNKKDKSDILKFDDVSIDPSGTTTIDMGTMDTTNIDRIKGVGKLMPVVGAAVSGYFWQDTLRKDPKEFMSPEEQQASGGIPFEGLEPGIQKDLEFRRAGRAETYIGEGVLPPVDPSVLNILSDTKVPSAGELAFPTTEETRAMRQDNRNYFEKVMTAGQEAGTKLMMGARFPSTAVFNLFGN
jgi:hypothetical protein